VTSWVNHDLGGQRHWHSGVRYAPKAEAKSEYRHLPRWDDGITVMSGRVRRETGKRQTVEVRHGEGVANRTGPE